MKPKTLLIVALVCFGALCLVLSTSAERQGVWAQPDAHSTLSAAQSVARQSGAGRRLPQTRENFDIRADHQNSLPTPFDAQTVEPGQPAPGVAQTRPAVQYKLQREHPGLQMKWSSLTRAPSRIWSFSESLTPPINADAEAIARSFLKDNNDLFRLAAAEVDGLKVARRYRTEHNGVTHITLGQQVNGIEVFQADFAVHIDRTGSVIAASGELIPGVARKANLTRPQMTAAEALRIAAQEVEAEISGTLNLRAQPAGADERQAFDRSAGFEREVETRLVYFPLAASQVRLAWEFILWMRETPDVYLMVIDAERGSLLYRYNLTNYDENPLRPHGLVFTKDSPRPNVPYTGNNNPPVVPREDLPFRAAPFNGREIFPVADQHYDWWAGVPANNLISNNTSTYLDRDATPGQPDQPRLAAPDGNFSFPADFTQAPTTENNQRAAQVNLFYWINRYHDILYSFGFNEAAGNFQTNNFGQPGRGADAILGEAQDGSGTNNANFSTPPDGQPGRVQMYLWTTANPQLDGDFDQNVIIHELTHGLSNRLVFNATGLAGLQAGGMGEGWSDYFGLVLLRSESDDLQGTYPLGGYVLNNYAAGIRRYPYSLNPTIFPLTYKDVAIRNQVHAIGEIWCAALLEMRALLIQRYGFQEGQRQSIQLVVDGLKLTPRAPSFVDARNAILLADRANNRGANQCLIWQAFAKRGVGFWASSTDSSDGAPAESLEAAPYCSDAGSVRLDRSNYVANETARIALGDRNAASASVIVTSSATGDQEAVQLAPDAGLQGGFSGAIKLAAGRARPGDGALQGSVEANDRIVVTYSDANAGGGFPAAATTTAAFARERTFFEDTIEDGNQGWLAAGAWAMTNARAASPTRCWTDSPAGNYANNTSATLTSPLFDLSGLSEVTLNFAHSYALEDGFDFGVVEFSTDDGATWKRVAAFSGSQAGFTQAQVRLRGLDGQARARVRFRLTSDVSVVADGWYVDDIRLAGRSLSPVIIPPGGSALPAISSVTPAFGPPSGGARVTIVGSNFTETDDTTVTFDNLPATSVNVVSGSVITAVAPPHAAGPVTVSVRNRQGGVSLVKGFTYHTTGTGGMSGAPAITSVYPAFGSTRGGTVVTLFGANFTPETVVLFGSTPGAATFVNVNTVRAITPAVTAAATVDVVAGNGLAGSRLTGGFNYINPTPPTVEVLSPSGGETFFVGSTINLRWRSLDDRAVARHRISLRRPSGPGFTFTDIASNIEGSAQSFAWTIPTSLAGVEGRIRVLVTDDEGSETEAYSSSDVVFSRRWQPAAPLPAPISAFGSVGDGRYIYRIGGTVLATAGLTTTVQRLDASAAGAAWTEVAPLPTALTNIDAVFLGGKIYVPGGLDATNQRITRHFVYDVATNAWTTQADAPAAVSSYVLVADEARGVYYQTGGFIPTGRVSSVRMFNPATNTWSDLPPLGAARNFHEAALIEGRLYVAGGLGNTGGLGSAEVFDFNTRQWTPIAPMNRPRSLATSFVSREPSGNPLWFVVGGNDPATGALLGAEVYDVRNNRWITLDNSFGLTTPRAILGGAVAGEFFYAYGGNLTATGAANERLRIDVISPIPFDPTPPALAVPATQIAVANVEVKFTVTANDLGSGAPLTLTARGLPPGASFTTVAATNNSVNGRFRWTPAAGDTGKIFNLSFTAGAGQLSETKQVTIRVVEASRLTAVNSADFRLGPIAPDSIASIFGVNLAVRSEVAQGFPLPLDLAGTTVTVNGAPAQLFAVSPGQINFAVPPSVEPGEATIIVSNPAGSYSVGAVEIAAPAPALFTLNSAGTGDAYALATIDGVTYQSQPFDVLLGGRPNIVVFFGTGVRRAPAANPNDDDGVAESVAVTIGDRPARVLYAGAQGDLTGFDQLNVELPASLAGGGQQRVEVVVTVAGVAANRVTIRIR